METLSVERLQRPWRRYVAGNFTRSSSSTPFVSAPACPSSGNMFLVKYAATTFNQSRHGWPDYDHSSGLQLAIPFSWEESPGTLKKPEAMKEADSVFSKDSDSAFSKDSELEFPSSLHTFSIENPVDYLTEMESTYFSAPSTPGRENFGGNEKHGGNDKYEGFDFSSRRVDADSATSMRMSFADELFFNGLILPLKPPPRLQAFAAGDACTSFRDKSFNNGSSASQASKSAWKFGRCMGVCGFLSSCFQTNAVDIDIFLGMNASFSKSSHRKQEWMKTLSRFSLLGKNHKDTVNLPSLKSLPKRQNTKSRSDGSGKSLDIHGNMNDSFESQKQSDFFPTKSFGDVQSPKKTVRRHVYDNSKRSKNDRIVSINFSLSKRWFDKSYRKLTKNAQKSCSTSTSVKSIPQTKGTKAASTPSPSPLSFTFIVEGGAGTATATTTTTTTTSTSTATTTTTTTITTTTAKAAGSKGCILYEPYYRSFRASTEHPSH